MADNYDEFEILKGSDLFSGMPESALKRMAGISELFHYKKGDIIYGLDDEAYDVFVLISGRVRFTLYMNGEPISSSSMMTTNEVFGWAALVEGLDHRISVAECVEPTTVLTINGERLLDVFESEPEGGFLVMRRLAPMIAIYLAPEKAEPRTGLFSWFFKWSLARQMWSSFAVVVLALGLAVSSSFWVVQTVSNQIRVVMDVRKPMDDALLEMEINTKETAQAILDYVFYTQQRNVAKAYDSMADFETFAAKFDRLAKEDKEKMLGQQVSSRFRLFQRLGDEIMTLAQQRSNDLFFFRSEYQELDELIDKKLRNAIDRAAADSMKKLETALDMNIRIEKALGSTTAYILKADPGLKRVIQSSKADFKRLAAVYRETTLSAEEAKWLDQIDRNFRSATTAGNEIIVLTNELNSALRRFGKLGEEIDAILDDQVQPLVHEQLVAVEQEARRSSRNALIISFVLIFSTLGIVGGAMWYTSQSVAGSISRRLGFERKTRQSPHR